MDSKEITRKRKHEAAQPLSGMVLYTIQEVCPILGVTYRTAYSYIQDGRLKARKLKGQWKITREDLIKFIGVTSKPVFTGWEVQGNTVIFHLNDGVSPETRERACEMAAALWIEETPSTAPINATEPDKTT